MFRQTHERAAPCDITALDPGHLYPLPVCLPDLIFVLMFELIDNEHKGGSYVILMRYVFKLNGWRSKGRPKMFLLFRHFVSVSNKNLFSSLCSTQ